MATCILQTLCNVSQVCCCFFFCVAIRLQRGKQSNSEHQVIGKTHTTIKVRWVGDSLIINKPTCITWELSLEKAIILYSKMYCREGNNFLKQKATCIIQALCIVSLPGFVFIIIRSKRGKQTNTEHQVGGKTNSAIKVQWVGDTEMPHGVAENCCGQEGNSCRSVQSTLS